MEARHRVCRAKQTNFGSFLLRLFPFNPEHMQQRSIDRFSPNSDDSRSGCINAAFHLMNHGNELRWKKTENRDRRKNKGRMLIVGSTSKKPDRRGSRASSGG